MQQQLSQLLVLHRRLPDGWKPILHQHIQNVPGVPLVGLLPAWTGRTDRGCIPQQKLMTQLIHQPPKPTEVPRSLSTETHSPAGQRAVKLLRLFRVAQAALTILARLLIDKGDLLKPRMKITSYNHHARLLSSRAVGRFAATSLLRSEEPTLSCNHFSPSDFSLSAQVQAISNNPAPAIILKGEYNARHAARDPASEGFSAILCSMDSHRCGASLVA